MSSRLLSLAVLAALAGTALAAPAQGAAPAEPKAGLAATATEPAVKRTVIEDDNARIEEVRVRGAVRSTKVKPKGPIKAEYEVLPLDAGRDNVEGPHSGKGATGQAVWRVLSF
ncbi:MAG TPA: hypothetical protein VLI72_07005 [Methylibium sp.]|nr:hypothetical protein [Methylibium sp.]